MEVLSYKKGALEVSLLDGRRCTYFDVPETVHGELIASESPLNYFNQNIWGINYEHEMQWESLDALLVVIADILLVDPPISVNERPIEDTPLHVAAVWGDVRAVAMLLENGAEVNALGDMSCTPIYNAIQFDHWRCAKMMLKAGARFDDENELGETARERALRSDNEHIVALAKKNA